jgi:hypothetical protein
MLFIRIDPLKETRSKKSKKRYQNFFRPPAQSELYINGNYYAFQHAAQPTIVKSSAKESDPGPSLLAKCGSGIFCKEKLAILKRCQFAVQC